MILARSAEQILSEEAPEVLDKALADLDLLPKNHPEMIEHERDHRFTECATYADDIKPTWGGFQTSWHFINLPYLDEDGSKIDDFDFT